MLAYGEILDNTASDFLDILGKETVTYLPFGGDSRSISAIVNRNQPAELGDAPHGHAPLLTMAVQNDAASGISSAEINTGKDKVKLPVRIGQTAQERLITKILSQDAGMMKLEVR